MNRLATEKRAQIIGSLVEGTSIRATVRMTGAAKNTVTKLLVDLGAACADYQDRTLRDLPCTTIQADETWAYCYAKQKNVPEQHRSTFGYGDVWTWTALCADTKLGPSWLVGERTYPDALAFLTDLESRLANAIQLTTDGHRVYLRAVEQAFREHWVDYAMLVKLYGPDPLEEEHRYSPPVCTGTRVEYIEGRPDPEKVSTSYVERQNLTMRMGMRRFTRLTNAFSKKVENLAHAVSLHYMHYNFARPHKTLSKPYPTTPAMAAGVADHVWSLREIAELLDRPQHHEPSRSLRRASRAAHASITAPAQTDPLPGGGSRRRGRLAEAAGQAVTSLPPGPGKDAVGGRPCARRLGARLRGVRGACRAEATADARDRVLSEALAEAGHKARPA